MDGRLPLFTRFFLFSSRLANKAALGEETARKLPRRIGEDDDMRNGRRPRVLSCFQGADAAKPGRRNSGKAWTGKGMGRLARRRVPEERGLPGGAIPRE